MKYYILKCIVSSLKLPAKGSLGDPKKPIIVSEKQVAPIKNNIPFLIATGKIEEFETESEAKYQLEKLESIDAEFTEVNDNKSEGFNNFMEGLIDDPAEEATEEAAEEQLKEKKAKNGKKKNK